MKGRHNFLFKTPQPRCCGAAPLDEREPLIQNPPLPLL